MTKCEYGPVQNDTTADYSDADNGRSWIPFFRQLMLCIGVSSLYFQLGLCLGSPTVVIPRMREEKGEDYITPAMASWMYSAMHYSSVPCYPILAILVSYIGRRFTFGLGVVASLVSFSILFAGNTPQLVLGALIVQGLSMTTVMITYLIITEYTSPQYRGVFLTLKSATLYWGIWVANAIGTVAHWRYIAALGLASGLYNVVTLFMWPESPYWLASKGRLEQCRKSHRWLKGRCASSDKELQELMNNSQKHTEDELLAENRERTLDEKWRQIYHDMKSKYVLKSVFISLALHLQYSLSGKMIYTMYAIDIIKSITKSKSEAYKGMLILDGVTVLGMYLGCALSKKLKRRTLLFSSGAMSVVFLLLISLYLYLIRFGLVLEFRFITLFLLTGFSLSVSCGPIILNMTLAAELLSLRLRATCSAFLSMAGYFVLGTTLKVTPSIFTTIGMPGAFLIYGMMSGIMLTLLYIYLPETKDKTLKEIENLIISIGSKSRIQNKN